MDLKFDFKRERARLIYDFLHTGFSTPKVVLLTCGNAAQACREHAMDVVELGGGPCADLAPNQWMKPGHVARLFPDRFDATSGHLPLWMLIELAKTMRVKNPDALALSDFDEKEEIYVPSGSGESAVITALAFPALRVVACFDDSQPATTWNDECVMYNAFFSLGIRVQRHPVPMEPGGHTVVPPPPKPLSFRPPA